MSKPFTVFHLDGERGLRGGERQLLYLAEHLRAAGRDNVIVCRAGSELETEAAARGFETLPLPFRFEWDPVSAWRLRRRVLRGGPAILHAHSGHAAALAFLAGLGTSSARVVHRRVDFGVSNPLSFRLKYGCADRVIAITEEVKRRLLGSGGLFGGLANARVAVVRSAIAAPLLAEARALDKALCRKELAAELGIGERGSWIGFMGALVPHKDPATFVRAAARVLNKRPDAFALLAGAGPLEADARAAAAASGCGERILFLGERKDNLRILKSLDVFVLSSRMEGMGSVLLEAMACGAPIVATRAGGIPEVVTDGDNGLLAPPGRPEAIAERVLAVLDSPELAERLRRSGDRRVEEFTAELMGQKIDGIYRELLAA